MTDSPAALLQHLLEKTRAHGATAADARYEESASLSVEVRNGDLEGVEREESKGVALRAFVGQRQANVSATDLSKASLDALCERVVLMAKQAPEDPYCAIADASEIATDFPDLDLDCDDTADAAELERRAKEAEAAALAVKGVKQIDHAGANWGRGQTWLAATNGFSAHRSSGSTSLAVVAIAERDGNMERDYEFRTVRKAGSLPAPEFIGQTAAARAVARMGPKKVASQTAPVIFENRLASRLLGAFIGAVTGPSIARGVSFLKGKVGEPVFADAINIVDDPQIVGGYGSRSFDGEGRRVATTAIVKDGVLTQWLLNGPSAKQLGLDPNGFASTSFGDTPGVSTSNVNIEAGALSLDQLMAEAGTGLLVTDMFGPSLNPNTGDYSVGVSGFWIENGQRAYPVSEVTVAGDLPSMFLRAVAGSDLDIRSSSNSPSLLIPGMSIAGT